MKRTEAWMILLEKEADEMKEGFSAPTQGSSRSHEKALAKVDEFIYFKLRENGEYHGHLRIQNTAGSCSIIYKIKTTSPANYRVKPTIAAIEPRGVAKVFVSSIPGFSAEEIQRDRFQVQVCILPKDVLNDEESSESMMSSADQYNSQSFDHLNETFKILCGSGDAAAANYTVAVRLEEPKLPTHPNQGLQNKEVVSPFMNCRDLEQNIAISVYNLLQPKLNFQRNLCIFLAIFLCLLGVVMALGLNCPVVPPPTYPIDEGNQTSCGSRGRTKWWLW